jgi:hypothetical protein
MHCHHFLIQFSAPPHPSSVCYFYTLVFQYFSRHWSNVDGQFCMNHVFMSCNVIQYNYHDFSFNSQPLPIFLPYWYYFLNLVFQYGTGHCWWTALLESCIYVMQCHTTVMIFFHSYNKTTSSHILPPLLSDHKVIYKLCSLGSFCMNHANYSMSCHAGVMTFSIRAV